MGRSAQKRQALFRSLIVSLIRHGRIKTSQTKAKVIRPLVEKLVTLAKKNDLASARRVHSAVGDAGLTDKLIHTVAPSFSVSSGYTKIVKTVIRKGDAAKMAEISWVGGLNHQPEKQVKTEKK